MENKEILSYEECLEIVRQFQKGGYSSEDEDTEKLEHLRKVYPYILNLLFHDDRDLTAEQILAEAKEKMKPILL